MPDEQAGRHIERSCLGKMLIGGNDVVDEVAAKVSVQDFNFPQHQAIYQILLNLNRRGIPIEVPAVVHESAAIDSDCKPSVADLAELVTEAPTSVNVAYECRIIREFAMRRSLNEAASSIQQMSQDRTLPSSELSARAESVVSQVGQSLLREEEDELSVARDAEESLDRLMNGRDLDYDVPTGFCDLDSLVGGWRNGSMVVLGARASIGKTSLMADFILHAIDHRKRCMLFSLEMSRQEMVDRLLCGHARVPLHELRSPGYRSTSIGNKLTEAYEHVRGSNMILNDNPDITMEEMFALAKRHKSSNGLDLICVDYLQLIKARDRKLPRQEQVSEMSRGFKLMAKTLDLPVIVLCQVNRASEHDKHGIPKMHNLRESGAIEQDADIVLLLHRKGLFDRGEEVTQRDRNAAKLIVAKNRSGPTGIVELTFLAESCSFENAARPGVAGECPFDPNSFPDPE